MPREKLYWAAGATALVVFAAVAAAVDMSEAIQVYVWCAITVGVLALGRLVLGPTAYPHLEPRWAALPLVIGAAVVAVLVSGRFKSLVLTGWLILALAVAWVLQRQAARPG